MGRNVFKNEAEFNASEIQSNNIVRILDKYPLPTKSKEVKEQSSGTFRFLHSLNPDTLQSEALDLLDCANTFWNLPGIKAQLVTKFINN